MADHWVYLQKETGQWVHQEDGHEDVEGAYRTQREAWEAAKAAARQDHAEAFLKDRRGRIRERNTYGHDPRHIPG